jgi:hypothetical protein
VELIKARSPNYQTHWRAVTPLALDLLIRARVVELKGDYPLFPKATPNLLMKRNPASN